MSLKVTTNNVPRDIIDAWDLTPAEREQFDYIDWEAIDAGSDSASFFRYRGETYDLGDMPLAPDSLRSLGWDGFAPDSFFSGIAVRYVDEYERVVVGLVFAD